MKCSALLSVGRLPANNSNIIIIIIYFAYFAYYFFIFLLGTQPYKETCGDKHKTRHRGCRDDVPMYREQLDRPGVSASRR